MPSRNVVMDAGILYAAGVFKERRRDGRMYLVR